MKKIGWVFICLCWFSQANSSSWQEKKIVSAEEEKEIVKRIEDQCKKIKLRSSEIANIVCFIENYFLSYVENGQYYVPHEKTGLACDIEYDPETQQVFVHEVTSRIFHRQKFLFKSIQYDAQNPKIVFVTSNIEPSKDLGEVKMIRKLPVSERLPYLIASPVHDEKGRPSQKIILPFYEGGDLKEVGKRTFSTREKVVIAMDLMEALKQVHAIGMFHGDVHGGNLMLTKEGAFKGVSFRVALIDWGSATLAEKGSYSWKRASMKDLYFAGCTLYCIFYAGKYSNYIYKKFSLPKKLPSRGDLFEELSAVITGKKKFLDSKKRKTVEEKLEWYVLRMMHPSYEMKEDAAYWYEQYHKLLNEGF